MVMAEYTKGIASDSPTILKDGHTMFINDVVRDLNRKSFLEQRKIDTDKCLSSVQYSLHCMEQADALKNNALGKKMVPGLIENIQKVLNS
ncbi:MAG: hypothetical protein L3J71_17785 [Victivallaceae bacterium]|nr:hypothetical protein [Victivallaceae bacterium]